MALRVLTTDRVTGCVEMRGEHGSACSDCRRGDWLCCVCVVCLFLCVYSCTSTLLFLAAASSYRCTSLRGCLGVETRFRGEMYYYYYLYIYIYDFLLCFIIVVVSAR